MKPFTIIVEFVIKRGAMAAFLPLMLGNARASLENEPGCQRFDVLQPDGEEDRILLYEIYDDRAAFDAHCAAQHFTAFDRATREMVARKSVTFCQTL